MSGYILQNVYMDKKGRIGTYQNTFLVTLESGKSELQMLYGKCRARTNGSGSLSTEGFVFKLLRFADTIIYPLCNSTLGAILLNPKWYRASVNILPNCSG